MATQDPGSTTIKPLTPDTWDLFAALVERHNGIFGGCWCIAFHPERDDHVPGYDGNRAYKSCLVEEGIAHAALVVRDGEDGEQATPRWLAKRLRPQHQMRGHHLGSPKTPKSTRTIEISDQLARILKGRIAGRAIDDFVFVTPTGLPIHNADFYERVWTPLMGALAKLGVAPFRFHDLRHTFGEVLAEGMVIGSVWFEVSVTSCVTMSVPSNVADTV